MAACYGSAFLVGPVDDDRGAFGWRLLQVKSGAPLPMEPRQFQVPHRHGEGTGAQRPGHLRLRASAVELANGFR